jgi:hypothetical protein
MSLGRDSENWRAISGYPAYQISDLGRVRSTEDWRILHLCMSKQGYYQISLSHNKKSRTHLVHRLVATEFIENPADKPCVDHIDRCKLNNFAVNLRWCTSSENNANRSKRANATSQFVGVNWAKHQKKWRSRINIQKKYIHIGYYSDEREAARAYDRKALELYGEFANINGIAPDDDSNTDSQDNDNPELTTPTSDYEEFTTENGDVVEED